jgi:hypothetical protein
MRRSNLRPVFRPSILGSSANHGLLTVGLIVSLGVASSVNADYRQTLASPGAEFYTRPSTTMAIGAQDHAGPENTPAAVASR